MVGFLFFLFVAIRAAAFAKPWMAAASTRMQCALQRLPDLAATICQDAVAVCRHKAFTDEMRSGLWQTTARTLNA